MVLHRRTKPTIGTWVQIGDPSLTEMMARSGFDWLTIDLEHTAISIRQCAELIRIIDLCGLPAYVRLSGHESTQIKRVLDAGASGVIAPNVTSAAQARTLSEACRYPPEGTRGAGLARAQGYGQRFDAYRDGAAREVTFIVQIEHIDGVHALDAILAVEGVDGFFIGPYDLSGSLGKPGDFSNTEVREALDEVQGFVGSTPHLAGTHVVDPEHEKLGRALEEGYDFVAFASDMLFFADNMEHVRSSLAHLR